MIQQILRLSISLACQLLISGAFCAQILADVYIDRKMTTAQVAGLTDLISQSIVPGGVRKITINGSEMLVRRLILPAALDSHELMDDIQRQFEQVQPSTDRTRISRDYQNFNAQLESGVSDSMLRGDAEHLVLAERSAIVAALDAPIRYKAGIWDIYTRIPIAAIDPDNSLRQAAPGEGFILMAEMNDAKTDSGTDAGMSGLWQILFQDNFVLPNIIGDFERDAPGYDVPDILRYPGSRRTLTFREETDRWSATSWSYESKGPVQLHVDHYVREFQRKGYLLSPLHYNDENESMVQMVKNGHQVSIYVADTLEGNEPVQITIQERSS